MSRRIEVCPTDDLPPGERVIVDVDGLPHSVGVFNVDGEYHALANVCPHHLGPLCEGTITGEMRSDGVGDYQLVREGEVIQCPWHGWKFDIESGQSVFNPHELRTRTYETSVETRATGEESPATGTGGETTTDAETDDDGSPEGDENGHDDAEYGTPLKGDEPPIDTYEVTVEEAVVVLSV